MAKRKPEQDEHDVLSRLAERVETAITTIQQLRRERDELRAKLLKGSDSESLQDEIERLRSERDEVRERVERLLHRLEDV